MMDVPDNISDAVSELDDYANDLRNATHHTIINAVKRYIARLQTEPLGSLVAQILPEVDFLGWYESARKSIGSMVGSGHLDWPIDTRERVALQADLLRQVASDDFNLIQYTYDFHYIENRFDTNIAQFITQDFEPFHRDLLRLVSSELQVRQSTNKPADPTEHSSTTRQEIGARPLIFLSHAAMDLRLAEYLEDSLRNASSSIDVFRTSRVGQIPSGLAWFSHIGEHLRAASHYVVLLTPASQVRPWISFETGAAWITGRKLVPVLGAGLISPDVVEPLRNLQLLSLENPKQAGQAFEELGLTLADPASFSDMCTELGKISTQAMLKGAGWEEVQVDGKRYAWDGPIEDLKEGRGVPLPDSLTKLLSERGLRATTGIPGNLLNEYAKGYQEVWHIDNRMIKHAVVSKDSQVLLVRPDDRA